MLQTTICRTLYPWVGPIKPEAAKLPCIQILPSHAGFNAHDKPLPSARVTLDEISQEMAPSRWLEEAADQRKPAQQLGTLGGGNHFLEVFFSVFFFLCSV